MYPELATCNRQHVSVLNIHAMYPDTSCSSGVNAALNPPHNHLKFSLQLSSTVKCLALRFVQSLVLYILFRRQNKKNTYIMI